MNKNEKILIGGAALVVGLIYFMPKMLPQSASGINPNDINGLGSLTNIALSTGSGYDLPAFVPSVLPPLSTSNGNYSTNVPWWLQNNNNIGFQGITPLSPIVLPSASTGCNTCSLMSNFFSGGQL